MNARMNTAMTAYLMMAIGAVLALVFAAGPLAESWVTQILFGAAILLLAAGAAVRRRGAKQDALSGSAGGEIQQAHAALESLGRALQQAQADCESLTDMPAFHQCVNDAIQQPSRDFLEHRQSLLDAYGIGPFAELMIRFASTERAINRTLSASADGVEEEARSCLEVANRRMKDCLAACIVTDHPSKPRN